jgi:hypothetical protein
MKEALLDNLNALRQEMADVYVPMCGNTEIERDFNSRCKDVKADCLAVVDRKIKDIEGC